MNAALTTPVSYQERRHSWWNAHTWRTVGQDRGMRFMALNEVTDETYTLYFPVVEAS